MPVFSSSVTAARIARSLSTGRIAGTRFISTSVTGPAFVFDIDGVLKQGSHVLPQALKVMRVLNGENKLKKKY